MGELSVVLLFMGTAISRQDLAFVDKLGNPTLRLQSQAQQIFNIYRVTIDLPEPVDKTGEWKLDLVGLTSPNRIT
jgi:hypothetical protein